MSDEITPQRLDELLSGEFPQTDAERQMLELAARIESSAPEPSGALRERVEAIAAGTSRAPRRRWFARPQFAAALGAALVALVAGTVVLTQGSSDPRAVADSTRTQPATPGAQLSSERAATSVVPQSAESSELHSGDGVPFGRSIPALDVPEDEMSRLLDELLAVADAHDGSIQIEGNERDGVAQLVVVTIDAPQSNRSRVRTDVAAAVDDARSSLPGGRQSSSAGAAALGETSATGQPLEWPLTLVLKPVP